jgi:hypothetical protein
LKGGGGKTAPFIFQVLWLSLVLEPKMGGVIFEVLEILGEMTLVIIAELVSQFARSISLFSRRHFP